MRKRLLAVGAALAALIGCQINSVTCNQECLDNWMDGPNWNDNLYSTDSAYRVIKRFPHPDSALLKKPVILAVHGFTASTFEWREFWEYADARMRDSLPAAQRDTLLVSLVLLGGHGRDIADFQASTWEDWGRPILDEYDSLVAAGYTDISFAASSTGCALLMQYLSAGAFANRPAPHWLFFIDPIVTPASKLLSLVKIVGPILGNSLNDVDSVEAHYWYSNRPAEDLAQLYDLTNLVKNRLEDGFRLPPGTQAKVWKALHDGSADPISALQIYKGMLKSDGSRIEAEMVDSHKHVFTRLRGRSSATHADTVLQQKTFTEMATKLVPAWPQLK